MPTALAHLYLQQVPKEAAVAAVNAVHKRCLGKVICHMTSGLRTEDTLDYLGSIYGLLAASAPRFNLVATFESASTYNSQGAARQGGERCQTIEVQSCDDASVHMACTSGTSSQSTQPAEAPMLSPSEALVIEQAQIVCEEAATDQADTESQQLSFDHVVCGGTFDRMHAGHRLLLAATVAITAKAGHVTVGITDEKYLENKQYADIIQPYATRMNAVQQFLLDANRNITIKVLQLVDPQTTTSAETDACLQAIVVSKETRPGADKINEKRIDSGLRALVVIVVPVIGAMHGENKLSSTRLRAEEASKQHAAG